MTTKGRLTVLGTGGWGTALAIAAASNGHDVRLWGRDPEHVATLARERENRRTLPGVPIPGNVALVADRREACAGTEAIVVTVPTQHIRATLSTFADALDDGTPLVSASKGLEVGTLLRPGEVLGEILGERPFAVISGPSHAEEVGLGKPTSMVVASDVESLARRLRDLYGSARMRLYIDDDPIGVEIAGALKNVMAIAAGVCDGLDLGDNAKAALVTRGLAEIARYGAAKGARGSTFAGLAGVGDLIVTCYSRHGRNRAVGERIARGESTDRILGSTTQVAEGVWTAKALVESSSADASTMPVCREVYAILFEAKDPRRSVEDLMTRPPRET